MGLENIALAALNERHLRTSDKFFRMFAGAASVITAFEDGIISLEIRVDNRLSLPVEMITRNIAKSWRHEKELESATGYVAHIYKTERPSGFAVPLKDCSSPNFAEEVVRRANEVVRHYPDILLTTIRGTFEKEMPDDAP
jgi:hypothetical protein